MNDIPLQTRLLNVGGRLKALLRPGQRSRAFTGRRHARFWWHQNPHHDYVPALYRALSTREWMVMRDWYAETGRLDANGEINVPAMSLLQGLIEGSGIRRTVELGHFFGYSTLLTGFMLRAQGNGGRMVSIDIDETAHAFVEKWVDRAGLGDHVSLYLGDSSAEEAHRFALQRLGGPPELILLDSSHQREHTLAELDRWVPTLEPGAIMLLHDTSVFARDWDATGEGGVQAALQEWIPAHPEVEFLNLNRGVVRDEPRPIVYKDGCGIGILQKRLD